ncbi:MAG: ABC transporter substrate-binding protein [Pseudaminobacter sp.]
MSVSIAALIRPRAVFLSFVLCLLGALPAWADRVVVDQLGNSVTIPDEISQAVVLQHHTLDVVVQLGAQGQVVGLVRDWQKLLGNGFERLAPEFKSLPQPGELTKVNTEELLSLRPDVVFVTHYAPDEMLQQIKSAGIPVIQIAFFTVPESERGKLNPVLDDEKKAYFDGLIEAVDLVGEVFGKQEEAKELVDVIVAKRKIIDERTADLPEDKRTSMYMANPDLNTYGSGKYTGVVMNQAGALNVAREMKGYGKVTMEQILAWNPDIVIVQDRYIEVADQIRQDPAWKTVKAVEKDQIYITPEYVKPWGHPVPESIALGELWMAKILHPDLFEDIDMDAEAQAFYRKFYRTDYVAQ